PNGRRPASSNPPPDPASKATLALRRGRPRPTPRSTCPRSREATARRRSTQGVTTMNAILNTAISPFVLIMRRSGLLTEDLDYHLVRASMVIMFFFFGYQKWWPYEAERLVPFISNGPLIFWLYPLFGHQGASWFLGVSEWTFGALLFAGFWDR